MADQMEHLTVGPMADRLVSRMVAQMVFLRALLMAAQKVDRRAVQRVG
jgi:hypothetical protein